MASPENVQLAARFGMFMLAAGGFGLITGTTLSRSGIVRRGEEPGAFYTTCICHLAVGAFCYFGQFFVQTA
ncbi:MAG: hypothetical protein ACKVY0_30540 [Prosthecobacter sp.]|uniref:hypothetical protein n=1 Tax=Prosthecobacter sp. TaxID=1965333 RepID=UPI0038FE30B2